MTQCRKLLTPAFYGVFAALPRFPPSFPQPPTPPPPAAFPPVPIAPVPVSKPGICAPWHRCVAEAVGVAFLLYLLATAAMFAYQRRGFDKIEPRQGSPRGVPVQKK